MKILITGAYGFIGKNLTCELSNKGYDDLCFCGRNTTLEELEKYTKECDFVFHLAGINRPEHESEFMEGNSRFTNTLVELLQKHKNKAPIVCTSSTQAALDNPYGKSKLAGEEILMAHGRKMETPIFVYRLTNVFGKWCKPNYNSVVATFCYNVARDISVQVNDENKTLELVYIDDVVDAFVEILEQGANVDNSNSKDFSIAEFDKERLILSKKELDYRFSVKVVHTVLLGELAERIKAFKESRKNLKVTDMFDEFTKKLYSTYLSYLPEDQFSYPLKMNVDNRGSFTEILKSTSFGQVSVNISKPEITKGNHWHHTKTEKFLVVSGEGVIRFRKVAPVLFKVETEACTHNAESIIEYQVTGEKLEVIDIPPGYTHNITNLGTTDMVTIMWANESFNKDKPDTYFLEV